MVWPFSLDLVNVSNTSLPVLEFKAPVGSSANTTFGSLIKALAIPTRWHSPPDSWLGNLFHNPSSISTDFNTSLAFSTTSYLFLFFNNPEANTLSKMLIESIK